MKRVPIKNSVFVCLMTLIIFTGCGLKGNPTVLSTVPDHRQIVQNMKAVSSDDAVILKWDFYNRNVKNNYIAIEKSEVGSARNECKDCPRTFERIGQISLEGLMTEKKESSALSFTDKKVVHGKIYNYRLMLCDDSGLCLEESATEINF